MEVQVKVVLHVQNFRKSINIHLFNLSIPRNLVLQLPRTFENCFIMIWSLILQLRPHTPFSQRVEAVVGNQLDHIHVNDTEKMLQPYQSSVYILLGGCHLKRPHIISRPLGQQARIFLFVQTTKNYSLNSAAICKSTHFHYQWLSECCNWLLPRNLHNSYLQIN